MTMIQGLLYILFGSFLVWMGAFILITAMLPKDFAIKVAGEHGRWTRENIFKLPPSSLEGEE